MAGLLVSVRSADEARAAVAGGASVIDVKEPSRGPLGRADVEVWRAVRDAVPRAVPVSVALGELGEWDDIESPDPSVWLGISFRKIGLAGATSDWASTWDRLRRRLGEGPAWVGVAYADWERAKAPHPDEVIEVVLTSDCAGLLIDTWDKSRASPVDRSWIGRIRRYQSAGRSFALAGGLDAGAIERLRPLRPELFAVRGAACDRGRHGTIEAERVRRLAEVVSFRQDDLDDVGRLATSQV